MTELKSKCEELEQELLERLSSDGLQELLEQVQDDFNQELARADCATALNTIHESTILKLRNDNYEAISDESIV